MFFGASACSSSAMSSVRSMMIVGGERRVGGVGGIRRSTVSEDSLGGIA
jgi:hypothetical protein